MVAMADLYATIILPEQIIEAPQETTVTWQELIPQILGVIYWSGVLLFAIRFLIQLGSIIRLHFLCPKSTIQGSRVHILKTGTGPFSFFHWIFIHPESHTESEISEIITQSEEIWNTWQITAYWRRGMIVNHTSTTYWDWHITRLQQIYLIVSMFYHLKIVSK